MTFAEILEWVDRKLYNQVDTEDKFKDLMIVYNQAFMDIKRLKHEYEEYETITVADKLEYDLPSDCSVDNVISVQISNSPNVTDSTSFNEFRYAGLKDRISGGRYYTTAPDNKIAVAEYGRAYPFGGRVIKILYYPSVPEVEVANPFEIPSGSPALDSQYHMLICYGLAKMVAVQGHNADTEMHDFYQREYDELMLKVQHHLSDKFNVAPSNYNQVREWF